MTIEEAEIQCQKENIQFPPEWKSPIATGTAPHPEGEGNHMAPVVDETPPSPRKKRRGRTAGVDRIAIAITVLNARLKDGESVAIAEIAKQAGCTPKNLERSKRFMGAYGELTRAQTRAVRFRGRKTGGILEAWTEPREDQEEDDRDF
jgi:hypothetical protein